MSRIKILRNDFSEIPEGWIPDVLSAERVEKLNSDNTLSFTTLLAPRIATLINETNVIEWNGDYFDIAEYTAEQKEDGRLMISADCEHISYRLNLPGYNVEYFTEIGTPTAILNKILQGTPFQAGVVEFNQTVTFSAQEAMSRRGLLMSFAVYIGAEVEFRGFTVSLVKHLGDSSPKNLTADRNIRVMAKKVNKRELDHQGHYYTSYECSLMRPMALNVGDMVSLHYPSLGIGTQLRVVSIQYDPYNPNEFEFEIGNFVPTLQDEMYRIETNTVAKDKLYHGVRIGPEYGFESVRSDKLARSFFNSDTFAMQSGDGSGDHWEDQLYFDPLQKKFIFNGALSADLITALEAEFDVTVNNVVITNTLAAENGTIAELTVDQLETSNKVKKYLASDKSDVNYIRAVGQMISWITASTTGEETEQAKDRHGNLLYWKDAEKRAVTTEETEWPVTIYVYSEQVKRSIAFDTVDGKEVPIDIFGSGTGVGDNGKGFIRKTEDAFELEYISQSGKSRKVRLDDFGISLTPYDLQAMNFYNNGFSVKYSGETVAMTWVKDQQGRIKQLTDTVTGRVIPVSWHSGDM